MADDRYKWLDRDAAERLLRGSSVDARHAAIDSGPDADGAHPGSVDGDADETGGDGRAGPDGASQLLSAALRELADEHAQLGGAGHSAPPQREPGGGYPHPPTEPAADAASGPNPPVQTGRSPGGSGPVGGPDTDATTGAAAPAGGGSPGELPGEAAAVEAFRAAHGLLVHTGEANTAAEKTVSAAPGPAAARGGTGAEPVSRGGRASGRAQRTAGGRTGGGWRAGALSRPLRAGVAMAVAGCALGGVAVAAGAGVLSVPFAGRDKPAATAAPVVSPDDGQDQQAAQGGESALPDRTPGGESAGGNSGRSPATSPSTGRNGDGGPGAGDKDHDREDDTGDGGGRERPDGGNRHGDPPGDDEHARPHPGERGGPGNGRSGKKAAARQLCIAYQHKQLTQQQRRKLERAAGGPAAVRKFCGSLQHGGGPGHGGGSGGPPGGGHGAGPGGRQQHGPGHGGEQGLGSHGNAGRPGGGSGGVPGVGGGPQRPGGSGGYAPGTAHHGERKVSGDRTERTARTGHQRDGDHGGPGDRHGQRGPHAAGTANGRKTSGGSGTAQHPGSDRQGQHPQPPRPGQHSR